MCVRESVPRSEDAGELHCGSMGDGWLDSTGVRVEHGGAGRSVMLGRLDGIEDGKPWAYWQYRTVSGTHGTVGSWDLGGERVERVFSIMEVHGGSTAHLQTRECGEPPRTASWVSPYAMYSHIASTGPRRRTPLHPHPPRATRSPVSALAISRSHRSERH